MNLAAVGLPWRQCPASLVSVFYLDQEVVMRALFQNRYSFWFYFWQLYHVSHCYTFLLFPLGY